MGRGRTAGLQRDRPSNLSVQPLPDAAGWRASFDLQPQGDQPSDMRLFLTVDGTRLTETWTYVWYPDRSQ